MNGGAKMRAVLGVVLLALTPMVLAVAPAAAEAPVSRLVKPGPDGRLVYSADARGNRIPDFSHAGYGGGGVPLPRIATRITVQPGPGDDGARIQAAIDALSARTPDAAGFRGAVELTPGSFEVGGQIRIRASGIVLRGAGSGAEGTVILATGTKQRRVIVAAPALSLKGRRAVKGTKRRVTDAYVPVGARAVTLKDATPFKTGDTVVVERPSTAKWIHALGMDRIPPRRDGRRIKQWRPGKFDIPYNRVITAIRDKRIRFDAPLFHALDAEYGGGVVYKYDETGLLRNVGVENLRGVSATDGSEDDEDHAWTFIYINGVVGGWVRGVTAVHFGHAAVRTGRHSKWITVQDSRYLEPVSRITGRRRYAFRLQGQLNLGLRLFARDGRHDFVTGRQWSSGIVFLRSRSENAHNMSESHARYATGILYDNIHMVSPYADMALALWNRVNKGSGHGWAAANSVIWNSTSDTGIGVEKPPLAQNYCIGCRSAAMSADLGGKARDLSPFFAPGKAHWEFWNAGPVAPESLYEAQLRDRLGPAALKALAP